MEKKAQNGSKNGNFKLSTHRIIYSVNRDNLNAFFPVSEIICTSSDAGGGFQKLL